MKDLGFSTAKHLNSDILPKEFLKKNKISEDRSIIIGFFPIINDKRPSLIAPFAIKNHYKEIIKRMKLALKMSGFPFSEINKKQVRFFSNSSFPEKDLAISAGLGFRGRNTLLINTVFGSSGLLGGMILPYNLYNEKDNSTKPIEIGCGTCRLCEEACPGGALQDYKLNREKCLQHWTTADGAVPDSLKEVWGERIYGCMICQDCCPWNRKKVEGNNIDLGLINPEPPLKFYLTEKSENIKDEFKGTALGMSWIKAEQLVRNAIISVPFSSDDNLTEDVKALSISENEGIRDAALWVLKKSDQTGH